MPDGRRGGRGASADRGEGAGSRVGIESSAPVRPDVRDPATPDASAQALGRLLAAERPLAGAPAASVHVPSRPETVMRARIPTGRAPIASVVPGTVVVIDTVSQQGISTDVHPIDFFSAFGVPPDEILRDAIDIYEQVPRPAGIAGGHVLTGPIHVEGAVPGDVLEVRILAAELRVPYGINRVRPGGGVLPDLAAEESVRLLRVEGDRFRFAPGISFPVAPFPGIVAVAPPEDAGEVLSRPPGRWGGNLDLKELTAGARLFLPVWAAGAQLYVGDPHGAQGDGEVDGSAVEQSSTYTLQLELHRGLHLAWPVAVTGTHLLPMGVDEDLDVAFEIALAQAIDLLVGYSDGALTADDAYALCSVAVDFAIAEGVNGTKVVYGRIPTSLFDDRRP